MYWRQSIPLLGGLKYNRTSTGKEYISYRKNGIYIREPVSDIKKDIKNVFNPEKRTLDENEVQQKIKNSFNTYNDAEIFNQVELLKQFNVTNDDIADVIGSAIFDGSSLTIDQLNHAKGIFSQVKCSKTKKKEIDQFIDDGLNQMSGQTAIPSTNPAPMNQQQLPSTPVAPTKGNNKPSTPSAQKTPVNAPSNIQKKVFEVSVDIFREDNGQYIKVSAGKCKVENNQVIISANVTKSFEIKDIAEIYKNSGKLFIYIKTRKQPFIMASNDLDDLFDAIANLFSHK